jgi:hypothetical protein
VPAGAVTVKAYRTGTTPQTQAVNVSAGQVAQRDFTLTGLTAQGGDTVKLDKFVVSDPKEMAGAAIAINTQRFAPNFVNVIAADEFGPMATRQRRRSPEIDARHHAHAGRHGRAQHHLDRRRALEQRAGHAQRLQLREAGARRRAHSASTRFR